MSQTLPTVRMTIDGETFDAQLQYDLAPRSCACLERLLPYHGELVHAQWSGQSCWSPLSGVWSAGSFLSPEDATGYPSPGHVLLFAGELSEPRTAGRLRSHPLCEYGRAARRQPRVDHRESPGASCGTRAPNSLGRRSKRANRTSRGSVLKCGRLHCSRECIDG